MMGNSSQDEDATAFDLTALLDVLSNIIFFLMASFGATIVAVLPATVPTVAEESPEPTKPSDLVSVRMRISQDGDVDISAQGEDAARDELKRYDKVIHGKNGEVDAVGINEHLWLIKQSFKSSQNLIVVPDADVRYAMMVEVMDVARERVIETDGRRTYEELFPAVVVRSVAP